MLTSWQRRRIAARRARCNRIAKIWMATPSWQTRLRAQARRVLPGLPLSEEEVLIESRTTRFAQFSAGPIQQMRLLRPLPDCMLAADGRTRFRYFKVPKIACSSVVQMLLAACGRSQDFSVAGQNVASAQRAARPVVHRTQGCIAAINDAGWHNENFFHRYRVFAAKPRADIRFCVVRDPVARFQSAFDDIAGRRSQFYPAPVRAEQFLCRLEAMMDEVRTEVAQGRGGEFRPGAFARDMHFCPQHFSLGEDAAYFTHIFNLRQLPQLRDLLSELAGEEIPLIHANARAEHEKTELTAAHKKRVEVLYARDYEVFGRWF